MYYARTDKTGRIIECAAEPLMGFNTPFINGEYLSEIEYAIPADFIIENELAVYRPTTGREIAQLKRQLAETDYITAKTTDILMQSQSIDDFIITLQAFANEYADVLEQRQSWRERINTLEEQRLLV